MIGLVGFSVYPSDFELKKAWIECRDRMADAFSLRFIYIRKADSLIEVCLNSLSKLDDDLLSKNTFFVGACYNDQAFSVDDHGACLEIKDDSITVKNDWLSSIPIFYNKDLKIISTFFNAIAFNKNNFVENDIFDDVGLSGYFKYGYSVFCKTPLKGVEFLESNSNVIISKGAFSISKGKLILDSIKSKTNTKDVIDIIMSNLEAKLSDSNDQIVLPLSGGLDSRMLAGMLKSKKPHTFTYSGSKNNFESVYAKEIASKLNLKWDYIKLDNYYSLCDKWCDIYGLSIHSHGMYQMEFYEKVSKLTNSKYVVSGIFADIWAGNSSVTLTSAKDLVALGYSHGLSLSENMGFDDKLIEGAELDFFNTLIKTDMLSHDSLHRIRLKIILIGYLISLPRIMGYVPITPFLNKKVALSILSLPTQDKINRKWQHELINDMNLNISKKTSMFRSSFVNGMDASAMLNYDFKSNVDEFIKNKIHKVGLNKDSIVKLREIDEINFLGKFNLFLSSTRGVQRIITKIGLRSRHLSNLRNIQCLYPINHYLKSIEPNSNDK